jgi:outer membrane assembly lipoprotein YfiO
MKRCLHLVVVASLVAAFSACSSASREDTILTELADMDKTEIFDMAEELYGKGKVTDARKYFSFVYDTFPNDPLGHKAALRVADTYAVKKDTASLTEARLRYRDFANRYPNDPDRDYALLMVGQTYSARNMKPDRDLSLVHEALAAYRQLIFRGGPEPDRQAQLGARRARAHHGRVLRPHQTLAGRSVAPRVSQGELPRLRTDG